MISIKIDTEIWAKNRPDPNSNLYTWFISRRYTVSLKMLLVYLVVMKQGSTLLCKLSYYMEGNKNRQSTRRFQWLRDY